MTQPMGEDHTNPSAFLAESILTTKLAIDDPQRAPLVLEMFTRYAPGRKSDRTIAAWPNATGARTARDHPFDKDAVREMLRNTAYAGYVSGLSNKSRSARGLHQPIVSEELCDRVQEVRDWRTRVVRPAPPSDECHSASRSTGAKRPDRRRTATRRLPAVLPSGPTKSRTPPGRGAVPKAGATGVEAAFVASEIEIRL